MKRRSFLAAVCGAIPLGAGLFGGMKRSGASGVPEKPEVEHGAGWELSVVVPQALSMPLREATGPLREATGCISATCFAGRPAGTVMLVSCKAVRLTSRQWHVLAEFRVAPEPIRCLAGGRLYAIMPYERFDFNRLLVGRYTLKPIERELT